MEIDFRAWSHKWKKLIYNGQDGYTIDVLGKTIWKESADDEVITLQQFIGLKDKNQRKIFAGDYLKITEGEGIWIFKVVYVPTKACFSLSSPNRFMDIMAASFSSKLTELYVDSIEVIGNEYENPEIEEILSKKYEAEVK